jgi:hypothetical protein
MVDRLTPDVSRPVSGDFGINSRDGVITAIHQPNYIPWLGYFFKIAHADKFVFLDIVAYPSGGSFVNRNYIKTSGGPAWLTIPVITSGRFGQLISEVTTDCRNRWATRHITTLRSNYARAPYFKEIMALLEPHYAIVTERTSLAGFNIELIRSIASYLGINSQFMRACDLNVSGYKTDLNLDICRAVVTKTYISGTGAKSFQEDAKFEEAGIALVYSSFSQRSYPQLFGEFVGNLSIVDVLMNCGRLGTRRLLGIESELTDGAVFDNIQA